MKVCQPIMNDPRGDRGCVAKEAASIVLGEKSEPMRPLKALTRVFSLNALRQGFAIFTLTRGFTWSII
jgi:hypothetical protein